MLPHQAIQPILAYIYAYAQTSGLTLVGTKDHVLELQFQSYDYVFYTAVFSLWLLSKMTGIYIMYVHAKVSWKTLNKQMLTKALATF